MCSNIGCSGSKTSNPGISILETNISSSGLILVTSIQKIDPYQIETHRKYDRWGHNRDGGYVDVAHYLPERNQLGEVGDGGNTLNQHGEYLPLNRLPKLNYITAYGLHLYHICCSSGDANINKRTLLVATIDLVGLRPGRKDICVKI